MISDIQAPHVSRQHKHLLYIDKAPPSLQMTQIPWSIVFAKSLPDLVVIEMSQNDVIRGSIAELGGVKKRKMFKQIWEDFWKLKNVKFVSFCWNCKRNFHLLFS
jgi:hypothetical protein